MNRLNKAWMIYIKLDHKLNFGEKIHMNYIKFMGKKYRKDKNMFSSKNKNKYIFEIILK